MLNKKIKKVKKGNGVLKMGAVFAISVQSGQEIYSKELLKKRLAQTNINIVKGVFASETYTDFINEDNNCVDTSDSIKEEDITSYMKTQRLRTAINNRRLQLEVLSRYNGVQYEEYKAEAKKEINQLEKEVREIKRSSKSLKSVIRGYILIELTMDSIYLPDYLWSFIKDLKMGIPSKYSIPEYELEQFFNTLSDYLESEVVMSFEKEKTYEEVEAEQKELLTQLNNKEIDEEEKLEVENKLDELHVSIVDKINEFLANKSVNNFYKKVNAFIKRGKKLVSLPSSLYCNLYNENEKLQISKFLQERDFLKRFEKYTYQNEVNIGLR